MKELKAKIKQCADERREYKSKLEEVYEMIVGEDGLNRYTQEEIIDRISEYYGAYEMLTHATSDEYVDLYNRMLEDK